MRLLRAVLAGTIVSVMVGVLPLGVAAQTGEARVVRDLVYATSTSADEPAELELTVHLAAVGEDAPVVVDVGGTVNPQSLTERGVSVFRPDIPALAGVAEILADPTAHRVMADALACAVRFARGSQYGSESAPVVLIGFSVDGGPAAHAALAGESIDQVWDEYAASAGGPPAQYECVVSEASTRVDGLVGVAGGYDGYVGYDGKWGREHMLELQPDLWATLWGTVGLHPELRVRLIHGTADTTIPLEVSVAFEEVLAAAGYDVELVEHAGGHFAATDELVVETVMELAE